MSMDEVPELTIPDNIDVTKVARTYERPVYTTDNSLVFIEELVLETERGQGRIYHTKWVRKIDNEFAYVCMRYIPCICLDLCLQVMFTSALLMRSYLLSSWQAFLGKP